jgi:hypothetical protein
MNFNNTAINNAQEDDIDEKDTLQYPRQIPAAFNWEELNQCVSSEPKPHEHLEQIAQENASELLDMRPYMIERPFSVT